MTLDNLSERGAVWQFGDDWMAYHYHAPNAVPLFVISPRFPGQKFQKLMKE